MGHRGNRRGRAYGRLAAALLALALTGCSKCDGARGAAGVVARYEGGDVTAEDLRRESSRLPPALRTSFETEFGRRELVNALVDKRLLVQEADRRGLRGDPEIGRQVRELEERLTVQALLAAEEKALGPPAEAELRAWYDGHRSELAQPERVRVSRVLAAAGSTATPAERAAARLRAERFLSRLHKGEPFATVAAAGSGAEKARQGDLGLIARGGADVRLEHAAFALARPGDLSPVVECDEGFAVLRLVERREARVPPFEEVRGEVANRLEPKRKRKAFDDLIERLRKKAKVHVELSAAQGGQPDHSVASGHGRRQPDRCRAESIWRFVPSGATRRRR